VGEALAAGTFDARVDRHLTWCSLLVDQEGWNQVIELLDECFADLLTVCRERSVAPTSSRRSTGTFFLAGFESPQVAAAGQLSVL
jgi:hypothetical protein